MSYNFIQIEHYLGGRTEYIVTIACVIGRSRMKGERIVTNLLPFGPVKPRCFRFNFSVELINNHYPALY